MEYPRRIMIVGNGGRECALGNALLLSPRLEELYITPANWGLVDPLAGERNPSRVRVLGIKALDIPALVAACAEYSIDLVVVGPEDPLCAGLADALREAGVPVVGPGREAARLEGSKTFAKEFMDRHGLPTAGYRRFTAADELTAYCESLTAPVVLKADGLAAGKGVIICRDSAEATAAARRLMVDREFGGAGDSVVAEEFLTGPEISWTVLVSGGRAELLGASTDYKPLLDGNEGPNTGGMGNICPTPHATPEVTAEFKQRILRPFMDGLKADGLDYRGFLFVGTMLTEAGLKVLEFNVRLGDPEAEVVLPVNDADWPALFAGVAAGQWEALPMPRPGAACVAVVAASANYPYGKSDPAVIQGFDRIQARGLLDHGFAADGAPAVPPVTIYFAGVGRNPAEPGPTDEYRNYYHAPAGVEYLATGGRVLAVSALGRELSEARRVSYEVLGNLVFEGMKYRLDIGKLG